MHLAGRTGAVFHSCQRLLSCPPVFMCSHVYLLHFQCRLVWPGVSPLFDVSACAQMLRQLGQCHEWHWFVFLLFSLYLFIYLFIHQNRITGLTSESQMRSNYLLKDKCRSKIWVNLTALVIETKVKRRKNGKNRHTSCSHLVRTWETLLASVPLLFRLSGVWS